MNMVERVARALWESEPVIYDWGPQERHSASWDDAVERGLVGVSIFRAFARAAIEAMREPTEAMIEASNREWDGRMSHRSSGAYRAMIDAALASSAEERG